MLRKTKTKGKTKRNQESRRKYTESTKIKKKPKKNLRNNKKKL